ncbi:MAG TPA: hypothetical protein VL361_18490 [Candidatus Limnocylindrales bacterium]|nr:hypothetical protein [Candidatus Limnocylindrales bacterium]
MSLSHRLFVIPLTGLLLTAKLACGAGLNAGFLWDDSDLTLAPGHRLEVLGPLFYQQQKESEHTWAIPPLLSYTKDPDVELKEFDFLYPILTYDQYGKQYRWQLLQLLSFSGGPMPDDTRDRFTIFPFYFQQRSSDPTQNYTAVAPFYGHLRHHFFRDEIFFVMFPFYSETRKKDVITDNYVYPFFHLRRGPGLQGWQLWPLVGHEHKEVTTRTNGFNDVETIAGHDKRFVLWPIYFNDHTSIGTPNLYWQQAILPFYSFERSAQRDSTTVLWPFFSKIDDRQKKYKEWDAPWPFIEFARGEGKTTSRVWPFFSQSHSPTLRHDFYAWPIYKYERAKLDPLDHQRTRILFYLYSDTVDTNTDTGQAARWSYLWPLYIRHRERNGNTRLQVLAPLEPLVPGSHKVPRDYSPLWSVWRSESNPASGANSQSFLWNLYRRDARPDHKKVSLLFGLFQYQSEPEFKRWRLFYIPLGGRPPAKAEFSDTVKP